MMKQYHEIKLRHPGILLFFRLGDFYEMFYEDAVVASRDLEITLTARNHNAKGQPIPMCGVPHHAIQTYLGRLIRKGHKVALCEQVENPRRAKGLVRREVVRIVTPGTVIEEGVLDSKENNYLGSLLQQNDRIGLSFLDLSTGEFWITEFAGRESWQRAREELALFRPRELVLAERDGSRIGEELSANDFRQISRTIQEDWTFDSDYARRLLLEHFQVSTLEGFGINGQGAAVSAGGSLLHYVRQTQKAPLDHITEVRLLEARDHLKIDGTSVRNLELVRELNGGRRWTLLSTLDFTRTAMGARLLRHRILRPSLDLEQIRARQDAVAELQSSLLQMERLGKLLDSIQDLERLLSRVTLGTANPRDLAALKTSVQILPRLAPLLEQYDSRLLEPLQDTLPDVAETLETSLAQNPPVSLTEGGIIAPGFHAELDQLRETAHSGKSLLARLESQERERTGISSLKVRYNKVYGYFIEVTRTHSSSVPEDYVRRQTLVGSERFITPELKVHEEKVLQAEERIFELERDLFLQIRRQIAGEAARIQSAARRVAELDVLLSLGQASRKNGYRRPEVDDSCDLEIHEGRHPVLEVQDGGEPFVPNPLFTNDESDQMLILTGPNMGGKSTYLRQNALIVIMAQMGSFVPAGEARIGLVDQIFTRVGASDDLSRGRSTFMVEMIETANILNSATRRSFILLDEVGRGTATFDGLSIAWAVAEFLLTEPDRRARTLFATHYQELTQLEQIYEGVKNYRVAVKESGDRILLFHRVLPGVANKSYGIEVARLAGLPRRVVGRAREILSRLERKELNLSGNSPQPHVSKPFEQPQGTLF
jgi:DNA mismatch repair protein MutS